MLLVGGLVAALMIALVMAASNMDISLAGSPGLPGR